MQGSGNTKSKHRHVALMNGRARACEVYPTALCKAIIRGLQRQLEVDGTMGRNGVGMVCQLGDDPGEGTCQFGNLGTEDAERLAQCPDGVLGTSVTVAHAPRPASHTLGSCQLMGDAQGFRGGRGQT